MEAAPVASHHAIARVDLADVPEEVCADVHPAQAEVMDIIAQEASTDLSNGRSWDSLTVHPIRLSMLRDMYLQKDQEHAVELLKRRSEVKIDPQFKVDSESGDLVWRINRHYLDYFCVSSDRIGLDACLPNGVPSPGYQVLIDCNPNANFTARYGHLGFDPTGGMFYLGSAPSGELWLGMRKRLTSELEKGPSLQDIKEPKVNRDRWQYLYMFVSYCLSQIPNSTIRVQHQYGGADEDWWSGSSSVWASRLSDTPSMFQIRLTNIHSEHRPYSISHEKTERLSDLMRDGWEEWVSGAPDAWTEDGWLLQHEPHSVVYRYGQNQRINQHPTREADNWERDLDYNHIDTLNVALASHIEATYVTQWEDRPIHRVLRGDGQVYNSPHEELREAVVLDELPITDAQGREIRVYGPEGDYRPRRKPLVEELNPCGLLLDLRSFPGTFRRTRRSIDPSQRSKHIATGYPQAFLMAYGHVQARTTPHMLDSVFAEINTALGIDVRPGEGEVDVDDTFDPRDHGVLMPIMTQGYNEFSHRIRASAQRHEVQLGKVTTAMAGSYLPEGSQKRAKWTTIVEGCQAGLPHENFNTQIQLPDVPRSMRMEIVTSTKISRIPQHHRRGKSIFNIIIRSFCAGWSIPEIIGTLKEHFLVLRPKAFPELYKWMTYGICVVIERIWKRWAFQLPLGVRPDPDLVELVAVLERTLAYAHTGNTKVLASSLMRPMWLVISLFKQGLPVFAPAIQFTERFIHVPLGAWPHGDDGMPASASMRAQVFNFEDQQFEVFAAHFRIFLAIHRPQTVNDGASHSHELRISMAIAKVALQVLFQDVRVLVSDGVTKNCKTLLQSREPVEKLQAENSRHSLSLWVKHRHPLRYGEEAFENLLRAVVPDQQRHTYGLPANEDEKLSVDGWVTQLISNRKTVASSPFFTKAGSFQTVLCVAVERIEGYARSGPANMMNDFVIDAFSRAAKALYINFVPWKPPRSALGGAPPSRPVYDYWMFLNQANHTRHSQTPLVNPATQARMEAEDQDVNAKWSIGQVTLQNLPRYFHRVSTPTEWRIESANLDSDGCDKIAKAYREVFDLFDMHNPVHHCVLMHAIFLTAMLPSVAFETKGYPKNMTPTELDQWIRKRPYIIKAGGGRGAKEKGPFVVQFVVYFLALSTQTTSLRKDYEETNSLPPKWSKKHSIKGLTCIQYIRIGLAHGLRDRVFKAARMSRDKEEGDWVAATEAEIKTRRDTIEQLLFDGQYGPFKATAFVLGKEQANKLANLGQLKLDPNLEALGVAGTSGSKRGRQLSTVNHSAAEVKRGRWAEGEDDAMEDVVESD
ncbi:hypothetical protein BDN72DRAFT_905733 [Pluteus cervinus]|uniref:Uncharacterized protein n=1 Tax=Pluteus cervinus TaxID=181527 RepID=A0ACD3A3Y9_9AGAR|nr:hypothetical protein BDN72DRAFT_905733 [Pluteus cervinus]